MVITKLIYDLSQSFIKKLTEIENQDQNYYYTLLYNIAGFLVDIGNRQLNKLAAKLGFDLLNTHKKTLISISGTCDFYYNYKNAKINLIDIATPYENTFQTIEE